MKTVYLLLFLLMVSFPAFARDLECKHFGGQTALLIKEFRADGETGTWQENAILLLLSRCPSEGLSVLQSFDELSLTSWFSRLGAGEVTRGEAKERSQALYKVLQSVQRAKVSKDKSELRNQVLEKLRDTCVTVIDVDERYCVLERKKN
jgi:hypothetical protein